MSNTERRDLLVELGLEDSIVFENPDYDSAIIGWDENSGRIIYDYEKMVEHLMEDDTIPKLRRFAGKELGKKYERIARRESERS